VSIALSPQTIARVDAAAKEQGMARAAYLRQKIMHMLHVEGL
jgi:predicted DNA-binding protein